LKIRGFELVDLQFRKNESSLLPLRGSRNSAGYDFFALEDYQIPPRDKIMFFTDVKAYMQENEVLKIYPRSSMGIKKNTVLANTVGIVDADYFSNPDNDGNIGICLFNNGNEYVIIKKGERVAQGVFERYLVSDNCNSESERVGGFGSTNVGEK
jgi:dUTP pyrophosphatase